MSLQTSLGLENAVNVQTARRFEDLLDSKVEDSPYEYSLMFSRAGWLARRRSKSRFKLLRAIEPRLRRILRPNERVCFVTTGTTATFSEQFFVGWMALCLNRRALVFTTERILLLQIDRKRRPRALISQMPIPAIASVRATWTGTCRVKLLDREVYNFQSLPGADRKFVAKLLGDLTQGTNAPFAHEKGIEHMCPHCFAVVAGHPPACPACTGEFKSISRAWALSLAFPGVGDWYLGHRLFASFEIMGAAFVWLAFVVLPLVGGTDPGSGGLGASYWITAAIVVAMTHGVDAVMTRHFALKGHHPAGAPPAQS